MRRLVVALAALLGVACAAPPRPDVPASHPYVVLVSFDAFRADYLDRYQPPALTGLARRGVRAEAMIPAFPSKTFPNHYSIATGLYPGHHGIVGNTFFDPVRRAWYRSAAPITVGDSSWYSGEPIWVTAERNGVKSASFFWAGSEAAIGGVRPTYWNRYDGTIPNQTRVNSVVSWLRLPPADRPHLVLLYFSEVDDTTHRNGPEAPNTARAVADVDRALGTLLDSINALPIRDSVNVIVVSDHGMKETSPSRLISVVELMRGDTAGVFLSDNGPTMSLWFNGDTARATRAMRYFESQPHLKAATRNNTPVSWHTGGNARFGDILLVADEGWIIQRSASDRAVSAGAHGWDPVNASMHATFVAAGPNVKNAGKIPAFENIHVYPFVAAMLHLRSVPQMDGSLSVLRSVLR